MKILGYIIAVAVLVVSFAFGVFTGVYRTFPWGVIKPGGEFITATARSLGLMASPTNPVQEAEAEAEQEPETEPEQTVEEDATVEEEPEDVLFATFLQNFDMRFANNSDPIPGSSGGLTTTPSGALIARDLDGVVYAYDPETNEASESGITLPPTNRMLAPTENESGRELTTIRIRYVDIHYWLWDEQEHLAVSYNYYNPDENCFVLRLDRTTLPEGWSEMGTVETNWERLLETNPCIPIHEAGRHPFAGHQAGGAIAIDDGGNLYFTVGDYEYDGRNEYREPWPQRMDNDYGKIFRFTPNGDRELVSVGHRNPQGITITEDGRIFTVEHSAQGGDELNLIRDNMDYGWPTVNLGVDYGSLEDDAKAWDSNPRQGRHEGFEPPFFAWLPSVAPSSVAYLGSEIPRWEGDLLVGTLAGQSLRRIRIEGDRVLYEEPIRIGARIRDLAVEDGRIYLLYDDGRLAVMEPRIPSGQ